MFRERSTKARITEVGLAQRNHACHSLDGLGIRGDDDIRHNLSMIDDTHDFPPLRFRAVREM
jgi:hypothetical protein